jgi:hypothetical protein
MKYFTVLFFVALSACASSSIPVEEDRLMQLQYMQDVSERKAFRPEVYAEPEFEADCIEYQMEECYK